MDKYQEYFKGKQGETALLDVLFAQVEQRQFEEAFGTAMRIKAIKDVKWELGKLDKNGK